MKPIRTRATKISVAGRVAAVAIAVAVPENVIATKNQNFRAGTPVAASNEK